MTRRTFWFLLLALCPPWCSAVREETNVTRLDCGMRSLALQYALKLQPWRRSDDQAFVQIHEALRLSDLCGIPRRADNDFRDEERNSDVQISRKMRSRTILPPSCLSGERHCIFVSAQNDDSSARDGSVHHPVSTVQEALSLSHSRGEASRTTIYFRRGIHQLASTVMLGPADSGLELQGFPEEEVWISGGVAIPNTWKPSKHNSTILVANLTELLSDSQLPKVASVFATFPHRRLIRARFPDSDPEVDQWGYASPNNLVYSIDSSVVTEWIRPPRGKPPKFVTVDLTNPPLGVPVKNDSAMPGYNLYTSGSGGVCADLWGPEADSYWCSNASAGGGAEWDGACASEGRLQIPVGMEYNQSHAIGKRLHGWGETAIGGILHAWHPGSWCLHMFEINQTTAGSFRFAKGGGKQGGRNWFRCDQGAYAASRRRHNPDPPDNSDKRLISGTWLVENVLAELDQPGEFYFEPTTKLLYLIPNATHAEQKEYLSGLRFALVENIMELRNVTNITISNIGFRDSAATFMGDWSAPSGGDWALHRGGALFLENVEGIKVLDCTFRRLDGNAIFLSRRTRHVAIERNTFEWIGENAIATWGETKHYDATGGNQPRYTLVQDNIMRELGIYQKQSSAWAQAKAALSTIRNNIMFNMPRAAINFNDMMGGGDVVERNLIFNTCRESGDHGPINSWDRQPFMTKLRDGKTRSFDPIVRVIARNLIFANYGGSQAVDNDDGSSWFHLHDNVFYAADGFKMDYGGHDSVFENNLIMTYPYDGQQCLNLAYFEPGHGDIARGNKCIVGLGKYIIGSGCGDPSCASSTPDSPERLELVVSLGECQDSHVGLLNNSYYTPNGTALFQCGYDEDDFHTLKEMQQLYELELGSSHGKTPSVSNMIEWAKEILF